jgi:hypothetical protein
MRRIVVAVLAALGGCTKDAPQKQQHTISPPMIVDSAAIGASDDSALESAISRTVVTTNGDTLVSLGGILMNGSSAHDFGIRHYTKNGNQFVRVAQIISKKPDGNPVWKVIARLRMPHVKSPEDVNIDGFCEVNRKNDPLIFAVTGEEVSRSRYQALRAWRVEPGTKTVREIPADSVACGRIEGGD